MQACRQIKNKIKGSDIHNHLSKCGTNYYTEVCTVYFTKRLFKLLTL